jgi:hypothetical protein
MHPFVAEGAGELSRAVQDERRACGGSRAGGLGEPCNVVRRPSFGPDLERHAGSAAQAFGQLAEQREPPRFGAGGIEIGDDEETGDG